VTTSFGYLIEALRANKDTFRDWSARAEEYRSWYLTDLVGFAFFVVLTYPEIVGLKNLYARMFSAYPLPAWRQGGVTNEHIETSRHAIFFYILFVLYQLVQFAFTLGASNEVERFVDFLIQLVLLGVILGDYESVRQALWKRHTDGSKRGRVADWLKMKFEDMNISFTGLRRKVIFIFLASFALVLIRNLPWIADLLGNTLEAARTTLV